MSKKKVTLAIIAAALAMALAFLAGAWSVITAPKYVDYDKGATIILTDWCGHYWEDLADKASHIGDRAYLLNW